MHTQAHLPGAILQTLIPFRARSLAIGRVIPTMAPLLAEYAAWPIWPSNAAQLAVLIMTPLVVEGLGGREGEREDRRAEERE